MTHYILSAYIYYPPSFHRLLTQQQIVCWWVSWQVATCLQSNTGCSTDVATAGRPLLIGKCGQDGKKDEASVELRRCHSGTVWKPLWWRQGVCCCELGPLRQEAVKHLFHRSYILYEPCCSAPTLTCFDFAPLGSFLGSFIIQVLFQLHTTDTIISTACKKDQPCLWQPWN